MRDIDHIIRLLKQYLNGSISPENNRELRDLFEQYPDLLFMVSKLEEPEKLQQALQSYKKLHDVDYTKSEERVLDNILDAIHTKPQQRSRSKLLRYVAAACLLFIFLFALWNSKGNSSAPVAQVFEQAGNLIPGGNRAMLTTSDGATLELSERHNGIVVNNDITYDDGSVVWSTKEDEKTIMTLSTPKGGQYQIELSDGTKVWLNAASKIRYPKIFPRENRVVELEGEAYFEVAENSRSPFLVRTGREEIQVLGTHFNVNSFSDEKESKVCLVKGKVRVSVPHQVTKVLSPGEQTIVKGDKMTVQRVNVEESIAWKNGEFMFNNEPLGSALRQLARWYDIDIELDPSLENISLWGSVSRMDNFDKVLKVIKMTDDDIKVNITERRVKLMR